MAKMRVPERGSEEERRYYLTKEGLKDFDSYKEFDWRRALELLFEDAPDVNWWDCSAIGSRMLSQALHFPEVPLSEKILTLLFASPVSMYIWVFVALVILSIAFSC